MVDAKKESKYHFGNNYRKIGKCQNCLPDYKGAIFYKVYSSIPKDSSLYWECQNCGFEIKVRIYKKESI